MKSKYFSFALSALITFLSINIYGGEWINKIETDKARYEPGSSVVFLLSLNKSMENLTLSVKYYHLDNVVESFEISVNSLLIIQWKWNPPSTDYRGYLVKLSLKQTDSLLEELSIAVDVSSSWTRFPRYGFLSHFGQISPAQIGQYISKLNRYHINGLQFYDWHYKHHKPLKGTPAAPASNWLDIANRTIYSSTVQQYIDSARTRNIKSMAYNLLYGAYSDASLDGVPNDWRMFTNSAATSPDFHDLPSDWASDIYLMDPENSEWQNYIINEMGNAISAFKFDGWHSDQLGDRGVRYNKSGSVINVTGGFKSLLAKAKNILNCDIVMNAVNQYGQSDISQAPLSFLYTEVWEPNTTFEKLGQLILENDDYTSGRLKSVIAAYIHKAVSGSAGFFNTPSVLYANSVIFAFGGAHMELGEHMLSNEYFPVNNLSMTQELEEKLTVYYDFLVAYQNLLREGGDIIPEQLYTTETNISFNRWSRRFAVWNLVRKINNKYVFHLLNFSDATTLDWRDNNKTQKEPQERRNIPVYYNTGKKVLKIWIASPDINHGLPQVLDFTQSIERVNFSIPSLKYWNMIVIEFDPDPSDINENDNCEINPEFKLHQNFPNPFNPGTQISYQVTSFTHISLKIYDVLGREVATLIDEYKQPGTYTYQLSVSDYQLTSGVYFYRLKSGDFMQTKKMMVIK